MKLFFGELSLLRNKDVSFTKGSLKFFIVLLFLVTGACDDVAEKPSVDDNKTAVEHAIKHQESTYVCPMHPKIIRSSEASCPICGMDLVRKKIKYNKEKAIAVELTANVIQKLGVKTEAVEKGRLWKYIKTVGYVIYDEKRIKRVVAPTDGWVENLSVRRAGLQVRRGQLLMELYSPEFLMAQKDFIAAQKKDKSGVLKKYEQRQESVEARDRLRYMGISESLINEIARTGKVRHRIPIYTYQHGNITRHNVHKKKYVWEGELMFTIADLSSVWVEANVYEHQLDWVKRKQMVDITVPALPGRKWKGMVTYIFPELDPKTRTLRVRIRVRNYDSELKPNMFAKVKILGGAKKEVLSVSRQAVIITGERESVILDKGNGKFQPVDVITGMHSQGKVEILSGLEDGDKVVVSGQFLIDSEANLQSSFNRLH